MKPKDIVVPILCVALPLIAGGISGALTSSAITGWYATLVKPSFNPPNYLFGPVWTALYVMMGVSLYMIYQSQQSEARSNALLVFCLQLFLNFWWSIFFFSFQRPDIALVEIGLLWLSIIWMIFSFRKIKPLAGYLQIPYLCWVSFASILNAAIWWLNR